MTKKTAKKPSTKAKKPIPMPPEGSQGSQSAEFERGVAAMREAAARHVRRRSGHGAMVHAEAIAVELEGLSVG
ncbi:MAG: hypothetical protein RLP09_09660 [Sandaracinaceae bacterium]